MDLIRQVEDAGPCDVFILGLEGWLDAGKAASTAAEYLVRKFESKLVYYVDSDLLYDYTIARPIVQVTNALVRQLSYPRFEIYKLELGELRLLVARGHEPHRMWLKLIEELVELARRHDIKLIVTFGSMLDDLQEVKVSAVLSRDDDVALIREIGVDLVNYSGPCSFYTPLVVRCREEGIRCVSLWAHIPMADYYEVLARYNIADWRGTAVLLEKFAKLTKIDLDLTEVYERAYEVDSIVRKHRSRGFGEDVSKYLF